MIGVVAAEVRRVKPACKNQVRSAAQFPGRLFSCITRKEGTPPLADSRVRTPPEKAERSCLKCNSRRDLLQNPIGTLVGTTAIAAKCEDVSLSENLGVGARGVLI